MKILPIQLFFVFLFAYSENTIASVTNNVSQQYLFSTQKRDSSQLELSGQYILKFTNTAQKRKWIKASSVGLSFFPDTYLYGTGRLLFDTVKQKVALSSISAIASLPSSEYGSYIYILNGNLLAIKYNRTKNYGQFKIVLLNEHWLVLEDNRTKTQWKFYKK
jgi:hypothetical protein